MKLSMGDCGMHSAVHSKKVQSVAILLTGSGVSRNAQ